jgi:hypothetical protein
MIESIKNLMLAQKLKEYRAFVHDVTATMLVFQFKKIVIRLFCLEHQHGRHNFCLVGQRCN